MRSLTFKMVIAFLGIALISIALIVLLARWNTNTEFSRYISDQRGKEAAEALGNYYQATGSWEGLQRFIKMALRQLLRLIFVSPSSLSERK